MGAEDRDIDRRLVERLIAGDQSAFREFFDGYFPRLYRFALHRVGGDEETAADAAQVAMTKAVQSLDGWRGEASLFTWLCQICRNAAQDLLRAQRRYRARVVAIDDDAAVRAEVDNTPSADMPNPGSSYSAEQAADVISTLLDSLPGRYGDALEWKYVEGLTVEQIAARLGTGTTATQSLLARARTAFRKRLDVLDADARTAIEHLL